MKDSVQILNFNKMSWEKIDHTHLRVCFYGSFDADYAKIENELNRLGMYAVKRTYDKKHNRTLTTYKQV